jgi:GTP-binding protein EngB required for normal cell division
LDLPHILSFVGVRRAGKSTLMRQMINHLIRERSVPPGTRSLACTPERSSSRTSSRASA